VCHSDINTEYKSSIHYEEEIKCIFCHGGNDSDLTLNSMSKKAGFKGKIVRTKIPLLCAGCHSNSEMMLQYGNFIDQYNIYKSSVHGKELAKGNSKVAVCTDCHGVHNIRKVSDPASSAYWKNIPGICARCHSDDKYMKEYRIPTAQFELYRNSVHGKLRLEKGDMRSPGCPDCHGSHGATPPGVTEVENVCGKCHALERKYFQLSPHRKALVKKKLKECITCHGSHGIEHADENLYNKSRQNNNGVGCVACHNEKSREFKLGQEVARMFVEAEALIDNAYKLTQMASKKGFDIDEELLKLDEANSRLNEIKPVTHSLSISEISEGVENAEMLAKDVQEMVNSKMTEWRDRRVSLVINVAIFVVVMILLYVIRRRIVKHGF